MPNTNNTKGRRASEPGKVPERAKSFHGRTQAPVKPTPAGLRRPKTQPELLSSRNASPTAAAAAAAGSFVSRPTKVLVNVTVKGSLGPLHLLISPEATVGELIAAAVGQCAKQGRRSTALSSCDAGCFGLHYSQFSLESLDRDAKLITLGSRNFFLCPKAPAPVPAAIADENGSSCSREATKAFPFAVKWQWLVDLLL